MASSSKLPTFAEYVHKLRKINPDVGILENDEYYDVESCSEYQLFKWVKSIFKWSAITYARVHPYASKKDIMIIYHGCLCFDDYSFVKKLQTKKVWSSDELFNELKTAINMN